MHNWFQSSTVLLAAAALAVAGIWLGRQNRAEEDGSAPRPPLLVVENGTAHRYNAAGKTETVLSAPRTIYYNDERGTDFTRPQLRNEQNGVLTTINADRALQNQARTVIDMQGNVVGTRHTDNPERADVRVESERVVYRVSENEVESDVAIKIETPDSITHAIGTIWYLNQNLFILKQNVRSQYVSHSPL